MAMTATQKQDAYKFFIVSFGAVPGVEYMNQIADAYSVGLTTKEIVNIYSTKPQFEAIYPRFLSNEQFADKLIENVVGASATDAAKTQAKADVVAAINAGWSKGDVVFQIFTNLSNKPAGDADWAKTAAMLNNKVKVAEYYTETLLVNNLDLGALGSPLQSVTDDAASVEAAKKGNGSLNNGQIFTLTTGTDVADTAGSVRVIGGAAMPDSGFKFSSANELVTASTTTLTGGDTLIDGSTADNDTLNVAVSAATSLQTLTNIETVNLTTTGDTPASAITGVAVSGLKTLNISGTAAGNITLGNFGPGAAALADTGVTTINASGLTTNVGIVLDSSAAASSAALTVTGAFGADNIQTGVGNDTISGGDGADSIAAGGGNDSVSGGAGADVLLGGNGNDTLNGDGGADVLFGGAGTDALNGGAGNDFIISGEGNNTVDGGAGNDTIYLGNSATILTAATWAVAANLVAGTNAFAAAAGFNNTVVLGADLTANGVDTISGFTGGAVTAAVGGDVLNVSAFLGTAVANYVEISGTDGLADNVVGSNVVVVTNTTLAAARAEVGGTGVVFGNSTKVVVLEVDGTTNTLANVRFVTTDANGTIVGDDVVATLVGQPAADLSGFVAANFV